MAVTDCIRERLTDRALEIGRVGLFQPRLSEGRDRFSRPPRFDRVAVESLSVSVFGRHDITDFPVLLYDYASGGYLFRLTTAPTGWTSPEMVFTG